MPNTGFRKTANCVELHTRSELEDVTLTFCCSDSIALPMLEKLDPPIAGASCRMLEFDADTAGPGCTHAAELNPVAAVYCVNARDIQRHGAHGAEGAAVDCNVGGRCAGWQHEQTCRCPAGILTGSSIEPAASQRDRRHKNCTQACAARHDRNTGRTCYATCNEACVHDFHGSCTGHGNSSSSNSHEWVRLPGTVGGAVPECVGRQQN